MSAPVTGTGVRPGSARRPRGGRTPWLAIACLAAAWLLIPAVPVAAPAVAGVGLWSSYRSRKTVQPWLGVALMVTAVLTLLVCSGLALGLAAGQSWAPAP